MNGFLSPNKIRSPRATGRDRPGGDCRRDNNSIGPGRRQERHVLLRLAARVVGDQHPLRPKCSNLDRGFEMISYQRYDRCRGCFVKETRESFLAQEASMPTLFYIHGNSLKHKGAMKGFWDVYEKMRCCPGKKRLVCWSWPAERVYKTEGLRFREMIRKNLQIKYVYAEYQGYYLAKLVSQMSLVATRDPVGPQLRCDHFGGGLALDGWWLHSWLDDWQGGAPVERANLRGVMISAAFDCDMLYPGHRYGQAFVAAEKIMSTFNCHDRTLRKWPKIGFDCVVAKLWASRA